MTTGRDWTTALCVQFSSSAPSAVFGDWTDWTTGPIGRTGVQSSLGSVALSCWDQLLRTGLDWTGMALSSR